MESDLGKPRFHVLSDAVGAYAREDEKATEAQAADLVAAWRARTLVRVGDGPIYQVSLRANAMNRAFSHGQRPVFASRAAELSACVAVRSPEVA
jgi:hypothetical protein